MPHLVTFGQTLQLYTRLLGYPKDLGLWAHFAKFGCCNSDTVTIGRGKKMTLGISLGWGAQNHFSTADRLLTPKIWS